LGIAKAGFFTDRMPFISTFQVLFIVSVFCTWNITTVEIISGIHLLKS